MHHGIVFHIHRYYFTFILDVHIQHAFAISYGGFRSAFHPDGGNYLICFGINYREIFAAPVTGYDFP